MNKYSLLKKILVVEIILLFIGAGIITSTAQKMGKLSLPTSRGNTLYVGGSSPGNYTKIQDAIDNASSGDTIFIYDYSSPYYENVIIDKSINLIGEKTETTIINGSGLNDVIMVSANLVTISNLSIVNSEPTKAGILLTQEATYGEIKNCICKNNFWGIDISFTSHVTVKNSLIIDNVEGIIIRNSSFCMVSNCSFSNQQNDLWIYYASQNRILDNNITHTNSDRRDSGIYCFSAQNNFIYRCSLVNNRQGIVFYNHSLDNTIGQCTIKDNICSGIYIWDGTNIHIIDSEISHNGYGGDFDQFGIFLYNSSYTNIERCKISENKITGVKFSYDTFNNQIYNSTISGNRMYGIEYSITSHQNTIYHNNLLNNTYQALDEGFNNVWDDGKLGNYWSDYTGKDINNDCIGDTPYNISGGKNQDRYPLILPYGQRPSIKIIAPEERNIYLRNLKIAPFITTLLLGNIKIKVSAANYIYGIDRVEFYIDNVLRKTDTSPPYNWVWRISSHLKHQHLIKIIAYDKNGNSISDELGVWKFF